MTAPRVLYTRLLSPLSPYRDTPNMPNWGLWHRVNDDRTHGIPRIACMAVWSLIGAGVAGVLVLLHVGPHPVAGAFSAMLALKVVGMIRHGYGFDPLDWTCDAGCWGPAGALAIVSILNRSPPDWRVCAGLAVLWLATYPFSTPR